MSFDGDPNSMRLIKELALDKRSETNESKDAPKIVNDPVHGHIELHPLCVKIIDTPQFQRLRHIRQMGLVYYIYPGAAHNRFEHSIGVCYLAGKLVKSIKKRQPDLQISDEDILCVQIAGLCHDLGHGPFSHWFDGKFIPRICPDSKWTHEKASADMFSYMIEENTLVKEGFIKYGIFKDIDFIKELITGPKEDGQKESSQEQITCPKEDGQNENSQEWPYKGRSKEKAFLYQVVSNKINNIDVDKWDYFARDCLMLGIQNNFDHKRCIKFTRVVMVGEGEQETQLCFRNKETDNLMDMFYIRSKLHRIACQHRCHHAMEAMLTDAMSKADEHIQLSGTDGPVNMSRAINDMKAYTQLTDNVFSQILFSSEQILEESKTILQNILKRKLFMFVDEKHVPSGHTLEKKKEKEYEQKIWENIPPDDRTKLNIKDDDVIVQIVEIGYGGKEKEKNPLNYVYFYEKDNEDKAIQIKNVKMSYPLPDAYYEQTIQIHCKNEKPGVKRVVTKAFEKWFNTISAKNQD